MGPLQTSPLEIIQQKTQILEGELTFVQLLH